MGEVNLAFGQGATMVDDALTIAVESHRAETVEMLLLRSTLCMHGGLSPVEAALHSYPRVSSATRVAIARLLLDLNRRRASGLAAANHRSKRSHDAVSMYCVMVGQTLLATAVLPEGPDLIATLVRDGHVRDGHMQDGHVQDHQAPTVSSPLRVPPASRADRGHDSSLSIAVERRLQRRCSTLSAEERAAAHLLRARELSKRVLHACSHMDSPKWDGYAGQRDAKTLLCGTVRVRLMRDHRAAYERSAERLHLCHHGLAARRWSPADHPSYPLPFRERVKVVLLCARRVESPLSSLPEEALHLVVEQLAHATFWEIGLGREGGWDLPPNARSSRQWSSS